MTRHPKKSRGANILSDGVKDYTPRKRDLPRFICAIIITTPILYLAGSYIIDKVGLGESLSWGAWIYLSLIGMISTIFMVVSVVYIGDSRSKPILASLVGVLFLTIFVNMLILVLFTNRFFDAHMGILEGIIFIMAVAVIIIIGLNRGITGYKSAIKKKK